MLCMSWKTVVPAALFPVFDLHEYKQAEEIIDRKNGHLYDYFYYMHNSHGCVGVGVGDGVDKVDVVCTAHAGAMVEGETLKMVVVRVHEVRQLQR